MSGIVKRLSLVAAVVAAGVLGVAVPANATPYSCGDSEWGPGCWATVTSINTYLVMHNQPNYSGGEVPGSPHWHNGDEVFLACWTTGSGDANGHGDHYWFWTTIGSVGGYINDWYVTTGSYSQWSPLISHC